MAPDGQKEVTFAADRIKYWLSVGAQPSERVARLLGKVRTFDRFNLVGSHGLKAGLMPPFVKFMPAAPKPTQPSPPSSS